MNGASATPQPRGLRLNRVAPIVVIVALGLMSALLPRSAAAHAELACSIPHANAVLTTAPERVEIWFTEEVDAELTTVSVFAEDGSRVDRDDTTIDLNDLERRHVTVSLRPGVGPGTYTVRWHAVTPDDQGTADGSFTFDLATPATPGIASPTPVASPPASPAASPVLCS